MILFSPKTQHCAQVCWCIAVSNFPIFYQSWFQQMASALGPPEPQTQVLWKLCVSGKGLCRASSAANPIPFNASQSLKGTKGAERSLEG